MSFKEDQDEALNLRVDLDAASAEPPLTESAKKAEDEENIFQPILSNLPERYEFISMLGQGGMGAVLKVRDTALAKEFALKMLRPQLMDDASAVKRFEHEARAAMQLQHPNIAAVYDYGIGKQGAPYLVMELLEGKDLESIIKESRVIDIPRSLDLFIQITEAMAYAHSNGVVHRDIKPSNIIIKDAGDGIELVKLVDFGIAKSIFTESAKTRTGDVLGSPLYMSPEQCEGEQVDARSDIYAFGCVMYECLSGRPPFVGGNPVETIVMHLRDEPRSLTTFHLEQDIPENLDLIVLRCLEKEPSKRYWTADEARLDLEKFRSDRNKKWSVKSRPVALEKTFINDMRAALIKFGLKGVLSGLGTGAGVALVMYLFTAFTNVPPPPVVKDRIEVVQDIAYRYKDAGNFDKAIELLHSVIGLPHSKLEDDSLVYSLGWLYGEAKDYKQALSFYEKILPSKNIAHPGDLSQRFIDDYAEVLRNLKRGPEADKLIAAFSKHK